MSEIDRIIDQLDRMYRGDAWHGPSLAEALSGVTASQAAARPLPEAHTIYELTHHVAAWIGEVHERLHGQPPGMPADGDFPPAGEPVDEAAWQRVRQRLEARHTALMERIAGFDPARLDDPVDPAQPRGTGTGGSYYALLHGLAQHHAYHAGQIAMLRKAVRSPR